jgi:hypothetical protein
MRSAAIRFALKQPDGAEVNEIMVGGETQTAAKSLT